MATTLSHSESRRLYSWWWDSHITPKNSKWLKENLTDMDSKVKAMIKLIEEDADSFARRAEMYYKKRPELIKLVEGFYRAYRALAERYDHATVELHQSLLDPDVLPTESRELSSADLNTRGYLQVSNSEPSHRGLKQLGDIFASETIKEGEVDIHASAEVQVLEKILAEIQSEKKAVVLQYQMSLQRLSSLEKELDDAAGLDERANRAEIEVKVLKETLAKLEAERDVNLLQYNNCLEKVSSLENLISRTLDETKGIDERDYKAEVEAKNLKSELSGLEAEKEDVLARYNQCLEMVSLLQGKISTAEDDARLLSDQTEQAEAEVKPLKQAISRLNEEKEGAELQYEICSRRIAKLELEISHAHEDVKRLNNEVETGDAKLKCVDEEHDLLSNANRSLQLAAGDLAQKIANKDQEVLQKGKDLEALQTLLQDEQFRFMEAEATLKSLQKLHSQSQEEQKALALKLDNKLRMLKDLETSNHDLQGDLQRVKEENQSLVELNSSSSIEVENLQNEICRLKESKGKLEEDLALQLVQSDSLHQEILHSKEEIDRLNIRYQTLITQLCSVGLDPESVVASLRDMQDENLKLKEACIKDSDEKNVLHEKLKEVNKILEKNAALKSSLSGLNIELEGSGERIGELKESFRHLHDKFDEEQTPFGHMLDGVKNLKCSFLKNENEKQQIAVENLVLCTFLNKLKLEGTELGAVSKFLEQDMIQQVNALEMAKFELLEMNKKLRVDANKQEEVLRAHLESQHLNLVGLKDSYQALWEENFHLVQQNSSILQKLGDLEEKNEKLEEDCDDALEEGLTLSNLLTVFGNFGSEKAEEVKSLGDLKKKIEILEEKLETKEAESSKLNEKFEIIHKKLNESEDLNDQLHCQIVIGKELLTQQALERLQADQRLLVAENMNAEVCSTNDELKRKCESSSVVAKNMEMQILTLSENFMNQKEEIEGLRKTNEDALSKMGAMHLEIEEHRIQEENLTLELHERVIDFQLWESEASSFYFDFQACSIREVILDNRVHELTSACEHLEEMNVTKDMEIERMKERFGSLESEIDGLKVQLSAYGPAIASLQKSVESLEHNALHANSSKAERSRNSGEDTAILAREVMYGEVIGGISDLLKMQARIGAVEKAMVEQASRLKTEEVAVPEAHSTTLQRPIRSKVKLDAPLGEAKLWELKEWLSRGDESFRKLAWNALLGNDSEISQVKTAILMKDIPLDQTVEPGFKRDPLSRSARRKTVTLSKSRSRRNVSQKKRDPPVGVDNRLEVPQNSAEDRFQDGNRRKILERIESDAKKLMSVQLTVQELKSKMETKKSMKADNVESERVKRQLLEVDEAILQLFSSTNQLARDIQETPSTSPCESSSVDLQEANDAITKRATERARRGSEKIGRLQFEVESIRYNVLQLEDGKKSKGKHRFPGSRTILRDFVYSGRRNSIRRRNNNACFCGCGRPLTREI